MKVGDLVKHKEIPFLSIGLVTEHLGVHCMIRWIYDARDTRLDPGPTLELNRMLEIINESR